MQAVSRTRLRTHVRTWTGAHDCCGNRGRVRWLWLVSVAMTASACSRPEPADLLITNARIYTLDEAAPQAEAMALRDGRILAIGSSADIRARYSGQARDLGGAMVLPGFHDAHVHPIDAGVDLLRCDLSEAETVEAILSTVAVCDERDPGTGWLLGHGWSLGLFPAGNPHRTLLDDIADDRPIVLYGADGHSSWANTAALERAGIGADTPDPPLGVIERDPDGAPSGTLRESAQDIVWSLAPRPDRAELDAALARGVEVLHRFGITSIIEANATAEELDVYRSAATRGTLDLRVVASQALDRRDPAAQARRLAAEPATDTVRADAVKIFLDGVLEGETAALIEPYLTAGPDDAEPRGLLTLAPSELARIVTDFDAAGVQVHVHAIGDRAVRTALDAFAAAREANGATDNRHHIAHLQLVDPADYGRFGPLDVTANFQAVWAFPDDYIVNINLPQVGPERVRRMYPIGSLARAGARIVGGSDWNVTTANPLVAIETALTRQDPSGRRDAVLNADEAVDLATMLRAYTVDAAWLMHHDDETGKLAPGFAADFVVLDRDLFAIAPSEIGEVRVLATYLGGEPVFLIADD